MKIAWLQDADPHTSPGGAELNDRAMIVAGIRRGHEIDVILPDMVNAIGKPDLAIVSNSMGFGTGVFDALAAAGIPYAIFAHDYGPWLCRWRLFYPLEDRCKDLCYLRDRWRPYLEKAKAIVVLSPLHQEAWEYAYPGLRYAQVPSAVPEERFFDMKQPRSGILAIHSGEAFKGWPQVRDWALAHPETEISLVGSYPSDAPANVKHLDNIPYDQMPALYNRFEAFLHLPDRPAPFERVIPEAYLSGCRVIGNANVGALSWAEFQEGEQTVRAFLRGAPGRFWGVMEAK